MSEVISFIASLPPIQSAMSVSGNRDGMRIKLDVSENEVPNAIKLMLFSGQIFKVTVEVIEQEVKNERKGNF